MEKRRWHTRLQTAVDYRRRLLINNIIIGGVDGVGRSMWEINRHEPEKQKGPPKTRSMNSSDDSDTIDHPSSLNGCWWVNWWFSYY